ncbi:MAG: alanine--tRNA ligase [Acidobacteriota bacterium]
MLSKDIRQSFIDFFSDRDHRHEPSAPLVPHGDATLLFTNAGMVQFKNYFLGLEQPPHPRAVTSQKCLRVSGKHNDLENVGPSPRHHTFFEMLGNFSFGDYFKDEAIQFAWELVTEGWGLPVEHLWATVYEEDDEAEELWGKISTLPAERIVRCGAADNFWAMGDTGPCGPCSEIFIDRSPELPKVPFTEGDKSGRYLEIWNLVFMQFDRDASGKMNPLPSPSIDTGSGLERVSAALQGVASNYDTDLFQPILQQAAGLAGTTYGAKGESDTSLRVIADHLRAVSFLVADGVIPGNEGRGYVLRRILRRAVRHGMRLGLEEPFLASLVPTLEGVMGEAYPQLGETRESLQSVLSTEETKFLDTLAVGAQRVQEAIEEAKSKGTDTLDGEAVFRLYDTYGLPLETLEEIAEEEQMRVDRDGFETALEGQRRRSRDATSDRQGQVAEIRSLLLSGAEATEFVGYDRLEASASVAALARLEGEGVETAEHLTAGQRGVAAFDRTAFYAESGGQVADVGTLRWQGGEARVTDVQKAGAGVFLHWLEIAEGELAVGTRVDQAVDAARRKHTERHHTATHLLHAALRNVVGDNVRQAGSLVHPERLRFDFTHSAPVTEDEQLDVTREVSHWIREAVPIGIAEESYDDAVSRGAMALFGEKYGDEVRTVEVPGFSLELCGGCHVGNTGEIGSFVIVSERGVASGVRRIEALCGELGESWQRERERLLRAAEQEAGVDAERLTAEIASLRERSKEAEKELQSLRMKMLSGETGGDNGGSEESIGGVKVLVQEVPPAPTNELRNLADVLRNRLGSGVVVLGTSDGERLTLIAAVTEDLTGQVNAGLLAKAMGAAAGGSGGGRKDFAQAGGKDPQLLSAAFEAARGAVSEQMEGRP